MQIPLPKSRVGEAVERVFIYGAPLRYAHACGSKELFSFSDLRHE